MSTNCGKRNLANDHFIFRILLQFNWLQRKNIFFYEYNVVIIFSFLFEGHLRQKVCKNFTNC